MKRLPKDADLTSLTNAEKWILKVCMSDNCSYDLETCQCNNRTDSTKYCENYSQMVKIYAKIFQPGLFMNIENVIRVRILRLIYTLGICRNTHDCLLNLLIGSKKWNHITITFTHLSAISSRYCFHTF